MSDAASIRTSGPAFRVVVLVGEHAIAYRGVQVRMDPAAGLLHLLDQKAATHFLSVPLERVIVEWSDPAALGPDPYVPAFGAGAFERMGQQISEMSESIGRAFHKE